MVSKWKRPEFSLHLVTQRHATNTAHTHTRPTVKKHAYTYTQAHTYVHKYEVTKVSASYKLTVEERVREGGR